MRNNGYGEFQRPKTSACFNSSFSHVNLKHEHQQHGAPQSCPQKGNSWPRVPNSFANIHTGDVEVDEYMRNVNRHSSQINAPPPGMEPTGLDVSSHGGWPGSSWSNDDWPCQSNSSLSTDPLTSSLYENISKYDMSSKEFAPSLSDELRRLPSSSRVNQHERLQSPPPTNQLPSSASNNSLSSMMNNHISQQQQQQQQQQHHHTQNNNSHVPSHRRTSSWTASSALQFSNLDSIR
jgi:hypothetical protein